MSPHLGLRSRAQRHLSGSPILHGLCSPTAAPPAGDTQQPLGLPPRTSKVLSTGLGAGACPCGHSVGISVVPGSCCSAPERPDGCASDAFRVEGRRLLVQDVLQGP
ncbi:hypothetical protein NDU88_001204 [Pleurodeles waltl]|uniref:Uncharacterized protein n=1 Tax=Pleurodeles waltl TaxID=8319 RepID=A0AAV7Q2F7_PLEWA|nr:hypothetical protein NDU88_001204 [Pleurodeles waltl]